MDEISSVDIQSHSLSVCDESSKTTYILPPTYSQTEKWVQEYQEQFGSEPSFF